MWDQLRQDIESGSIKALSRAISLIENEVVGYSELLSSLSPEKNSRIIGITGPPGAGKSTLTDALIGKWVEKGERVAVLCVDPSSPFHHGAILGDRIRMSQWYLNENVFIRSLASRGALGGLHPRTIEIADLLRSASFTKVIIETVGVGQSEVEIAGLADCTVVVLVPEGGDEIQTMKAGLMEIADVFVVNKIDRPGADLYVKNLQQMLAPVFSKTSNEIRIIKTSGSERKGLDELTEAIEQSLDLNKEDEKKLDLLVERSWRMMRENRMKNIRREDLRQALKEEAGSQFNLYRFVHNFEKRIGD